MAGRDYFQGATWGLRLGPGSVNNTRRIALWVGRPTISPAFFLHAGIVNDQSHPRSPLRLGWGAFFRDVPLPASPSFLTSIHLELPSWMLSLGVDVATSKALPPSDDPGTALGAMNPCHKAVELSRSMACFAEAGVADCAVDVVHDMECATSVRLRVHLSDALWGLMLRESGVVAGLPVLMCLWSAMSVAARCTAAGTAPKLGRTDNDRMGASNAAARDVKPSTPVPCHFLSCSLRQNVFCEVLTTLPSLGWLIAMIGLGTAARFTLTVPFARQCLSSAGLWAPIASGVALPLDASLILGVISVASSLVAGSALACHLLLQCIDAAISVAQWIARRLVSLFFERGGKHAPTQAGNRLMAFLRPSPLWGVALSVWLSSLHPGLAACTAATGALISCLRPFGDLHRSWRRAWLMVHLWGTCLWMPSFTAWLRVQRESRQHADMWEFAMAAPCAMHGLILPFQKVWRIEGSHVSEGVPLSHKQVRLLLSLLVALVLSGYTTAPVLIYSGACLSELVGLVNRNMKIKGAPKLD